MTEERSEHSKWKMPEFNNQTLGILVGVLAVVLVALLIVSINVSTSADPNPSTPQVNSNPVDSSAPSSSGEVPTTQPSTAATTAPTVPSTVPIIPTTPPAPPEGGKYIDVGSGYLAEVIQVNVETFDGGKYDDYSHPTNNYLPEGTVDYCAKELVYGSGTKYVQLRSGHRIYYDKKVYPFPSGPIAQKVKEVKQYDGWLPDHNEIGVAAFQTAGRHTVLTLNTLWKAPFYFETNQSGYANPNGGKDRDYAVTYNNATYVDITFCYATRFTGSVAVPVNHPLFSSAQLIQNDYDCTLRLYLRKTGGFYGWHAYYNENNQLCFQFLNPAKATAASNAYGADLTGVLVMIDVGHGGLDGGAVGVDADGEEWDEAELNLALAYALKGELESIGATVVLNRTGDTILNVNDRQEHMLGVSPDICIAIHQNSSDSASVRGFFSMYYTPWSQMLADRILKHTVASEVYNRSFLQWKANYFMTRQTLCPVVLTENGFISNADDLEAMIDPVALQSKAQAMAQGIADYFLEINR